MDLAAASAFYAANAPWIWVAVAVALLACEVATGADLLLWPAVSAAVVAGLEFFFPLSLTTSVVIFALLTIATTLVSRRFLRRAPAPEGDINDNVSRVIGRQGEAVQPFVGGMGRVFVEGKEWAAELDGGGELERGARVTVTGVSGVHLKVRAI